MHVDDGAHGVGVGEANVREEAAAQERVGQFLFVIRRDDDDRPTARLDRLARFVDEKLHAVEFLKEVVGELDVGLVDLVDQEHGALVRHKRVPELAALDVVADIVDARVAKLAVAQPRNGVVFVEPLQGLGGRLDMPFDQRRADRLGDLEREHGLAGAGLALDQKRSLERDRCVDRNFEVVRCDIRAGAFESHASPFVLCDRQIYARRSSRCHVSNVPCWDVSIPMCDWIGIVTNQSRSTNTMLRVSIGLMRDVAVLGLMTALATPAFADDRKQLAFDLIDRNAQQMADISDSIYYFGEIGMQEFESSRLLKDTLESAGFKVELGGAGMPTNVWAEFGSGRPKIAIVTEIDALPGGSQTPGEFARKPLVQDGPGHMEGHNTHGGVASMAAYAVKQAMQRFNLPGTVAISF